MSLRVYFIIIALFLAALVAGVIWLWRSPSDTIPVNTEVSTTNQPTQNPSLPSVNQNPVNTPLVPQVEPVTPEPTLPPPDPQELAKAQAMVFAEVFGSYSTDRPYENLRSLNGLVTPGYWNTIQGIIATGTKPQGFYAVTSRALAVEFSEFSGSGAKATVTLQRSERFNVTDELRLRYENIQLRLIEQNEVWLVESAEWIK